MDKATLSTVISKDATNIKITKETIYEIKKLEAELEVINAEIEKAAKEPDTIVVNNDSKYVLLDNLLAMKYEITELLQSR